MACIQAEAQIPSLPYKPHQIPGTERYCFEKVSMDRISDVVQKRARTLWEFVNNELQLTRSPRIVWISPADPNAVKREIGEPSDDWLEMRYPTFFRMRHDPSEGFTPRHSDIDEIWIRIELVRHPDLECVVAHEMRHTWQKIYIPKLFNVTAQAEADAYPYGYGATKRFLAAHGKLTEELEAEINSFEDDRKVWFSNKYPDAKYGTVGLHR